MTSSSFFASNSGATYILYYNWNMMIKHWGVLPLLVNLGEKLRQQTLLQSSPLKTQADDFLPRTTSSSWFRPLTRLWRTITSLLFPKHVFYKQSRPFCISLQFVPYSQTKRSFRHIHCFWRKDSGNKNSLSIEYGSFNMYYASSPLRYTGQILDFGS